MISEAEHWAASLEALWPAALGFPDRPATVVYPPEVQQSSEPYFTAWVFSWLEQHLPGGADQVLRGGLRVETTLDPRAQQAAVEEVGGLLEGTEPDLQMSLVAVEPPTGFVRAFVSGRDFQTSQVNHALGAAGGGSGRQAGSAFKPIVLAEALSQGISPEATYSGAVHQIGDQSIGNYNGTSYGTMSLRRAMWASVNTAFTRLILDVGPDRALDQAQALGLRSVRDYDPAMHGVGASLALGSEPVSPLDMASAFGVFAARGLRAEPVPVLRVTDREGNVLIDNTQPEPVRVLEEDVADNLTDVLRGVLDSGTASGRGIDRPAAGKTGTSQNHWDAWFVGYTPTLSTAVWMGYDSADGQKEMVGIKGVNAVTGGSHPARVWQAFMQRALADVPVTDFHEPAPIRAVADEAKREARRGFEPAPRMSPNGVGPGGPYVVDIGPPAPEPPTTTTTTAAPTTTTTEAATTTTLPVDADDPSGPPLLDDP